MLQRILELMSMKKVTIYTDGACSGNPGAGGWASVMIGGGKEKQISEDDRKSHEEEIQKLTDTFVADIEKHLSDKQKDIMTI